MDRDGQPIPADLVPLINLFKIPISTSEDERGFSAMNMVCTELNCLSIEITSCILFIKINGHQSNNFLRRNMSIIG